MKNLYKALADFQQEVPVIHQETTGYNYTYANLPTIFEVINPLLKKHGLGFTQTFGNRVIDSFIEDSYNTTERTTLITTLFHIESGEEIQSHLLIPDKVSLNKMNDFQVLGSAITYLRRYSISSILGLVTDKDIDAKGEQKSVADEFEL